jgi:hypothetical protein
MGDLYMHIGYSDGYSEKNCSIKLGLKVKVTASKVIHNSF